jgi:hypothetical protein
MSARLDGASEWSPFSITFSVTGAFMLAMTG